MIALSKGQKINLKKEDGTSLQKMCVGVNWGAIQFKGLFGRTKFKKVDLDASIASYDENGKLISLVYHQQLEEKGIEHSGDDRKGDSGKDDGLDNEVIQIDLKNVDSRTKYLAVILDSCTRIDFSEIPFASARIYSGTPEKVDEVHASFDIANDGSYSGKVAMIMGVIYKSGNEWKFNAIGEATDDRSLSSLVKTTSKKYIKKLLHN